MFRQLPQTVSNLSSIAYVVVPYCGPFRNMSRSISTSNRFSTSISGLSILRVCLMLAIVIHFTYDKYHGQGLGYVGFDKYVLVMALCTNLSHGIQTVLVRLRLL